MQRVDLSGELEIVAVDRIMPPLDIDAALETMAAQFANDIRPIRVAESRMPVMRDRFRATDAMLMNDVPVDRRVLAVNMKNLGDPGAQLRERLNQLAPLVTRFPLKA